MSKSTADHSQKNNALSNKLEKAKERAGEMKSMANEQYDEISKIIQQFQKQSGLSSQPEASNANSEPNRNNFTVVLLNCEVSGCDWRDKKKDDLKKHLEKVHGIKALRCLFTNCEKTFSNGEK